MFFDFINALLNLDLAWFIWLVQANIIYIFAFFAVCFFFWEGNAKKAALAATILAIDAWAFASFGIFTGWGIFVPGFLAIYYISKIAVLSFAETVPMLKNKLVIVSTLQCYIALVAFNLFIG